MQRLVTRLIADSKAFICDSVCEFGDSLSASVFIHCQDRFACTVEARFHIQHVLDAIHVAKARIDGVYPSVIIRSHVAVHSSQVLLLELNRSVHVNARSARADIQWEIITTNFKESDESEDFSFPSRPWPSVLPRGKSLSLPR